MPKSYITTEQRQRAHLSAWVYGCLKTSGITQTQLAERLGISQQALSKKIKSQRFNYDDMVVIFDTFKPEPRELDQLLGIDRHHKEYRNEQT